LLLKVAKRTVCKVEAECESPEEKQTDGDS
jgi:hypothetical protein